MATEMITLKLDDVFLQEVDTIVHDGGYQNRTEFIRNALRDKIEQIKLKKAMIDLVHLRGKAKKNTCAEKYEKIRARAFDDLYQKIR